MFITESFIMLNFPKTGSSFARAMLEKIYKKRYAELSLKEKILIKTKRRKPLYRELLLPNIRVERVNQLNQHGIYIQIPKEELGKEIMSIARNPYDRFLSTYEFRSWAKVPKISDEIIKEHFPTFPEISLEEYTELQKLTMIHGRLKGKKPSARIGDQSVFFIQMFFKNPNKVLENITDEYIDSDEIFEDMADVTFIQQENLRQGLIDFLLKHNFKKSELEIINKSEKVNTTKKIFEDRSQLWTQNVIDYIKHDERLIFRILEKNGINYSHKN